MSEGKPFGIKYVVTINYLMMAFCVVAIVGAVVRSFTGMQGGQESFNLNLIAAAIGFGGVPAVILFFINRALSRLNPKGRISQIVLSCILVLAVPVGTVLYGISIYFMLFDPKTKAAFKNRYQKLVPVPQVPG